MSDWTQVSYHYDGRFSGFLTCVFESYVHRESPACFSTPDDPRVSLWPERAVVSHEAHAKRVYQSLEKKISRQGRDLVSRAFLTCLPERELHLWNFIRLGYDRGPGVLRDLTDDRVAVLNRAVGHLGGEIQLLKGFLRFSQQDGLLLSEIEPKNRVLPLLRPHFCTRFSGERFVIYDRTHREALFYEPGRWAILPLESFHLAAPGQQELDYRRLWRRFYDTIAIEGRYNPKLRMTHMPKRYWTTMTEFQTDAAQDSHALPQKTDPSDKLI